MPAASPDEGTLSVSYTVADAEDKNWNADWEREGFEPICIAYAAQKAEENLRAKSLRAFKSAHPEVSAVRFSLSGYPEQEWMRNVPFYAISRRSLWA